MLAFLRHRVWPAFALLLAMTLLTGVAYPAAVTAIAQVAFPSQANGSMIILADGRTIGSALIGQCFSLPQYFWGRPSAAGATDANPCGYDASGSAGTNLGAIDQRLLDRVGAEIDRLRAANTDGPIPVDLVTTSASGLDPHISPAAAEYQVERVAAARNLTPDAVREAIRRHTNAPLLGFLGLATVNVLALNLDLDGLLQGPA